MGLLRAPSVDPQRYVSIKTIIQKTGVHRQTVHYYLRREVLPAPVRTSRTSALYHSSTVDLIQLVQALQRQQRLSLDEIVQLFRTHRYDVRAIRQAAATAVPSLGMLGGALPPLIPLSEVQERIDPAPPRDWVDQIFGQAILRHEERDGRKVITPDTMEALRALWEGVRNGASIDHFRKLSALVDQQAHNEFDRFLQGIHSLAATKEPGPQVARLFASLERFGAFRRKDTLNSMFMQRLRRPGEMYHNPNRTNIFPSRTFLQKMGLFRELDLILRQIDRDHGDVAALRNLARASYVSSDWARLLTACQEILRLKPGDPETQANLGQALMYLGRLNEAVTFLEDVIGRGPNPMAKIRLGQALAVQAYDSGDAARLLDAVVRRGRLAAEAIKEAQGNPGLSRKVRLNAIINTTYIAEPLGLSGPVEEDVAALYEEFRALSDRKLNALGKISLAMAKMYATYALYLVRHRERNSKADLLLAEIAKLDPDCVLAARRKPRAKR